MRKLAEKTGASSREIAGLVRRCRRAPTKRCGDEEGVANVAQGVEGAARAGRALEEILSAVQQNSESTANIQVATARVNELAAQVEALRHVASVGERTWPRPTR